MHVLRYSYGELVVYCVNTFPVPFSTNQVNRIFFEKSLYRVYCEVIAQSMRNRAEWSNEFCKNVSNFIIYNTILFHVQTLCNPHKPFLVCAKPSVTESPAYKQQIRYDLLAKVTGLTHESIETL